MVPIKVWVVEDDTVFRRTLQKMLNREQQMTCDRVFPSCIEFLEAIASDARPDLVLMDLGLPGMGGVEGIQRLLKIAPDVTVIVLTMFKDKEKVLQSLDAGAAGYLLKTSSAEEIINGLRQVFLGGAALSPAVAKIVLEEMRKPSPADKVELTAREIEVLELLAQDCSVQDIATALGVARRTAKFHLTNIYGKLHVQSQSGAVGKALRAGII
ncbi:response regulator [Pontiella sp.]|uniref:response regulator n=2 Tax=Pontiella sp. TaxID=2837462 RepID=UPI00356A3807